MGLSAEFQNIPESFGGNISFLGMVILGVVNSADIVTKIGVHEIGFQDVLNNDVTDEGGIYPFPTSAQTTTIVSTDANDIAGGTGVRNVKVEGLDNDYNIIIQNVDMNGTNDVELPIDLFRVNALLAGPVGSAESNLGNITASHGSDVLATMPALAGRDNNGIYTVPATFTSAFVLVCGIQAAPLKKAKEGQVKFNLYSRTLGNSWVSLRPMIASVEGSSAPPPYTAVPALMQPKTDLRWNAVSDMDETSLLAYFSLLLMK